MFAARGETAAPNVHGEPNYYGDLSSADSLTRWRQIIDECVESKLRSERRKEARATGKTKLAYAAIALALLGGTAGAVAAFRSAIPFGTASSWSSAVNGDPNATQGLWFNSNNHPFAHTTDNNNSQLDLQKFSPIAYGCVGDGVADDTTCVQSALTAATAANAVMLIPNGYTFLITAPVDVSATGKNLIITGGGTILQPLAYATTDHYFRVRNASSLLVDGVTFQGGTVDTVQNNHHIGLIVLASSKVTIQNCRFLNISSLALNITSNNVAGSSDVTTDEVIVAGNTFNNYGQNSMSFGGAKRVIVTGNTMLDARLSFFKFGAAPLSDTNLARDMVFSNNTLAYTPGYATWTATNYHVGADIRGPWKNVVISNNVFDYRDFPTSSHSTSGIALYEATDQSPTSATRFPVTVSITGNIFDGLITTGSRVVDGAHECQDFTFANNEVYGAYDGVSLTGAPANSQNVTHTSNTSGNTFRNILDLAIAVVTPSAGTHTVNVNNNVIEMDSSPTGGSTSILLEADPPNANLTNVAIRGNTILNTKSGIYVTSTNAGVGTTPIVDSALISDNRIQVVSTAASNRGIQMFGYDYVRRHVKNNIVQTAFQGIYLGNTAVATGDVEISGNTLDNCATGLQTDNMGVSVYVMNNIYTNNTTANLTNTTNPLIGITATGAISYDMSGSTGTFKTPSGAATFNGSSATFSSGISIVAGGIVDTSTAGTLNLGTGTANFISMGKTGFNVNVNSNLLATQSFRVHRTTIANADYTIVGADDVLAYTSISAARTVSIACATVGSSAVPQVFVTKDESGSASGVNTITISATSGTVDGAASKVCVSSAFGSCRFYANGAGCFFY